MTTTVNTDRAAAVERLYAYYENQGPYRCTLGMDPDSPLAATALMHLVSDRKILSMAKVGCVESDDFVYIYSMEYLDEELLETCCAEALEDALSRVDPNPNHNFSLASVVFLCDAIAPTAAAKLKKTKFHKDYVKPESGWADLRLAAVEIKPGGRTAANPLGKALLNICKTAL